MEQNRPQNLPLPPRPTRRRRRVRRAFAFGGILLFVAMVVIGIQGWRIVSALVEAERQVVVPLPTRPSEVELGGAANSDAEMPQITPEYLITPTAEEDGPATTAEESPGDEPDEASLLTPRATTASLPNVTVEPTQTPTTEPATAATATPSSTVEASATDSATASATSAPPIVPASESASATPGNGTSTPEVLISDGTGGPEMSTPATPPNEPEPVSETATATVTPVPTSTPVPTPTVAINPTPVLTASATSTVANGDEIAAASEATETATTPPVAANTESSPIAAANNGNGGGDDGGGGLSHLDVVQQLLGQGIDGGDPATSEVWNGETELTILVIGLDRRADGGDQNADVIIIAHIDLINRTMNAVSLPRDLLVDVPGVGYDKINGAYNHGILENPNDPAAGVAKVRDTIEYNFGVPIDHYVLIDFDGFVDVVDAVGGIDVDVPYDILDEEYPTEDYGVETVHFPAGLTTMDGETALKYVRTRHADSDDQRRERQLQVLLAIFSKGKTIGSVSRIDNMILALGDSAQTSFPLDQQLTLARLAMELESQNITLSSVAPPLIAGGVIDTGAWVYSGDMAEIAAFIQGALFGTGTPATIPESGQ